MDAILQKFKKPDKCFVLEKECLICLESVDIESQKIVKLPCECANSVYHIVCIIQLIQSGQNKNFCPHCKTTYELLVQEPPTKQLRCILFFHIFSNSVLNIINIATISDDYHNRDANIISKILLISYFCKMLFNCCITFYSKQEPEKNESNLWLSYIIQTTLFVLLAIMISKIENDFNSAMLMGNNVFFCFGDLVFRITVDCKNENRVFPYFGNF
jgi:hypothetical protein